MDHKSVEDSPVVDPERQRRFRVASIVAPGVLGAMMLVGLYIFDLIYPFVDSMAIIDPLMFGILAFALFAVSGVGVLMMYLQTGFKRADTSRSESLSSHPEIQRIRAAIQETRSLGASQSELSARVSFVEKQLETTIVPSYELTDSEREELLGRLKENIEKMATQEILEEIKSTVTEDQKRQGFIQYLNEQYDRTIGRLSEELSALSRRGNLNLSLGILTAVSGILILAYFVLNIPKSSSDMFAFTAEFIPRISLVLLVEIFAYFFLRLYSTTLMEIKFFQNEMTNFESKFLALRTAEHKNDETSIAEAIRQFAQTERNVVIQKGQTTVDIERSKAERETITSLARISHHGSSELKFQAPTESNSSAMA